MREDPSVYRPCDVLLSGRCISGAFAASKLGLTTSRVQVPLSHVAIDGEEIPIPAGKVTEGKRMGAEKFQRPIHTDSGRTKGRQPGKKDSGS